MNIDKLERWLAWTGVIVAGAIGVSVGIIRLYKQLNNSPASSSS